MKFYNTDNIYIPSLLLIKKLYQILEESGLYLTELSIKSVSFKTKNEEYIIIKNYNEFKSAIDSFLLYAYKSKGYKALILQSMVIKNVNLSKYNNEFRVDVRDLSKPKFITSKIQNKQIQNIIDREVKRYEELIFAYLTNYKIAYQQQVEMILSDLFQLNVNSVFNYVDIDFVDDSFVSPQQ